jgi:hypothetical protein
VTAPHADRHGSHPVRTAAIAAAVAALAASAAACSSGAAPDSAPPQTPEATPGQVHVTAPGVDLDITHAVAHLDASGTGTLTMTVHNGSGIPEHLDMVATPHGGRGRLAGGSGSGSGSMTGAGVLLRPGATVTFGAPGPTVHLTHADATADHTLPLMLEFGVARLVRLSATVSTG